MDNIQGDMNHDNTVYIHRYISRRIIVWLMVISFIKYNFRDFRFDWILNSIIHTPLCVIRLQQDNSYPYKIFRFVAYFL